MKKRRWIFEYILITSGVIMLASAISLFYEPNSFVTGGATGVGIIVQNLCMRNFGWTFPLWLSNIVINTPLFIVGAKVKGVSFLKRTFYATVLLSVVLWLIGYIKTTFFGTEFEMDMILTALIGGALNGTGIGIVFANSSTTGGSDLLATIIHHKKKHIDISKILLVLDAIVITFGFFTFGPEKAMYALIAVFVSSKMVTAVLEGVSFSKAAFIISDRAAEISKALFTELDRGATSLNGKGMYTQKEKNVLLCVVSKKEIVSLKELVAKIDKNAFVIVTDVREVLGEGFQKI